VHFWDRKRVLVELWFSGLFSDLGSAVLFGFVSFFLLFFFLVFFECLASYFFAV
jgi:hypothetical protein